MSGAVEIASSSTTPAARPWRISSAPPPRRTRPSPASSLAVTSGASRPSMNRTPVLGAGEWVGAARSYGGDQDDWALPVAQSGYFAAIRRCSVASRSACEAARDRRYSVGRSVRPHPHLTPGTRTGAHQVGWFTGWVTELRPVPTDPVALKEWVARAAVLVREVCHIAQYDSARGIPPAVGCRGAGTVGGRRCGRL
jgi:hypothetical protein